MNIAHFNTYDFNSGAAIAALRLHNELLNQKVNSLFVVNRKTIDNDSIITLGSNNILGRIKRHYSLPIDQFLLNFYKINKNKTPWSNNLLRTNLAFEHNGLVPDIYHFHWINHGFIGIQSFSKVSKPIIWTIHDSWAFTGGCHLPYDCIRYRDNCGKCPLLYSKKYKDLSYYILKKKQKHFKISDLVIVSPSTWLGACAKQSSLFKENRIEVIPNGVNTNIFKPLNKELAREILGIPRNRKVILFGAFSATSDDNKGSQYIRQIFSNLRKHTSEEYELLVFGSNKANIDFGYKTNYVGVLKDVLSLVILYSCADVFILPSKSENLPNTIIEAMSCGVPAIAFNVGGISDIIDDKINGYLIDPFNLELFADSLFNILKDDNCQQLFSNNARVKVLENFDIECTAKKYLLIYDNFVS